jgi:hypothetical protein
MFSIAVPRPCGRRLPDGQSALNLAAARLRHIAGTAWSTKRYLNIELLKDHLTAAGDVERAVDQWFRAGQYAAARSTPVEAISHFERGLAVLSALPEGSSREAREIELQLARGLSLFTAKGFSAVEALEAYVRAGELAERRGNPRQQFMAVYGLWQSANGAGRIHDCRKLSDQLLQLTAGKSDDELHLQAHHSAWATSMFAGDPAAAREHSETGRRLYDP